MQRAWEKEPWFRLMECGPRFDVWAMKKLTNATMKPRKSATSLHRLPPHRQYHHRTTALITGIVTTIIVVTPTPGPCTITHAEHNGCGSYGGGRSSPPRPQHEHLDREERRLQEEAAQPLRPPVDDVFSHGHMYLNPMADHGTSKAVYRYSTHAPCDSSSVCSHGVLCASCGERA